MVGDVIDNFGLVAPTENAVMVPPVFQKKRQTPAFIDKADFVGPHLLIHNFAFPYLPEK